MRSFSFFFLCSVSFRKKRNRDDCTLVDSAVEKKGINASISTLCHQHVTKKNRGEGEREKKNRVVFFCIFSFASLSTLQMIKLIMTTDKVQSIYMI